MKRYTTEQALEVLMDSDSDHTCFDHFESDQDVVVSEGDAFTEKLLESWIDQ